MNWYRISFAPTQANAELFANNVTITDTGANGVFVQPTGTGSARIGLSDVRIENYTTHGFRVDTTGNTGAGIRFPDDQVPGVAAREDAFVPDG